MGLIWEISAHAARQNAWNFGARLFCKNIKKSGFNDIYNIQFFQDTYSQNGFFPYAFQSPDPAARPTRPPVMDHRLSNWFVFQYFQVRRLSNWFVFQYFSVQRLLKWVQFQYFSVQNWLKWIAFQYFHNSNWFRRDFHIKEFVVQ